MDEELYDDPVTVLSADESWDFLAAHSLGRLAVISLDEPDIFPVNHIVSGSSIVFRSAEGTKLMSVLINSRVAFEVDAVRPHEGVSVVAKGNARILDDHAQIDALDAERLRPWIPTLKYRFVAIDVDTITGRRIRFGEEPDRFPIM